MIIVRISGGLGNQLFQLAFYNKLKREITGQEIKIDISFYEDQYSLLYWLYRKSRNIPSRKFMFKEQLNNEVLDKVDLLLKLYKNKFKVRLVILLEYFIPLKYIFKLTNINIINENNIDDNKQNEADQIYDGYWQNIRYIQNQEYYINRILKEKYNNDFIDNKTHNIVLHVRRGDQATVSSSHIYTILDVDYYERAINYIKLHGEIFDVVTICSDDILWCKDNIKNLSGIDKINYSNSSSLIEDFLIMYNAKYLISSNSTFSWWAGYIGNSVKFLIPKRWYTLSQSNFINQSKKIIEI
jgi:hypothetical protein